MWKPSSDERLAPKSTGSEPRGHPFVVYFLPACPLIEGALLVSKGGALPRRFADFCEPTAPAPLGLRNGIVHTYVDKSPVSVDKQQYRPGFQVQLFCSP